MTKIITVVTIRIDNLYFCVIWKIVGEIKSGPYVEAAYSDMHTTPTNMIQFVIFGNVLYGVTPEGLHFWGMCFNVYFLFELVHLELRLFEWSLSSIKLC